MAKQKHRLVGGVCITCGPETELVEFRGRLACWYTASNGRMERTKIRRARETELGYVSDVCEMCGKDRPLVADHDHETGAARGYLCGTCNSGLGLIGDTLEAAQNAVRYLSSRG